MKLHELFGDDAGFDAATGELRIAGDYVVDLIGESFNEHWRMFGGPQRNRGAA